MCVRACMSMRGSQIKDIGHPALSFSELLIPIRQSLFTEPGFVPSQLPWLASKPQGPSFSCLSLPPPAPPPSAVVTGVFSDGRVLRNWTHILKIGQQELLPTESSPKPLILPNFNVFRKAYQIVFCYHNVIIFLFKVKLTNLQEVNKFFLRIQFAGFCQVRSQVTMAITSYWILAKCSRSLLRWS